MARTLATPAISARVQRAFTMVELLVVVGIIAVLVGLSLVVGAQVMSGGKQRLTADAIKVLDQALEEYIAVKGGENPPALFIQNPASGNPQAFPIADARDMSNTFASPTGVGLSGHQMINSVGFFYEEGKKIASVRAILDKLPSQLVRTFDADADGAGQPALTTVFDGWGNPIRFVHPVWQGVVVGPLGSASTTSPATARDMSEVTPLTPPMTPGIAQIRRNHQFTAGTGAESKPDSDGAMCVGNRPYFYSAGSDGLVGVKLDAATGKVVENYNEDNVYTTVPNFTNK